MIIEAMKQALEALEQILANDGGEGSKCYSAIRLYDARIRGGEAITSLRRAIQEEALRNVQRLGQEIEAEAEKQEPFEYWNAVEGWVKLDEMREHFHSVSCGTIYKNEGEGRVPLYANQQPKREWVGLTDRDIEDLWGEDVSIMYSGHYDAIRAIEAKLKQKNGYTEEKNT